MTILYTKYSDELKTLVLDNTTLYCLSKQTKRRNFKIKLKPGENAFDVFTRRFGKDRRIKTFRISQKADKFLKLRLSNRLSASGFFVDARTGLLVKPKLAPGFRRSKTRPNVIVEKLNRRISRGTKEVPDIIRAKRQAPPKLKFKKMRIKNIINFKLNLTIKIKNKNKKRI